MANLNKPPSLRSLVFDQAKLATLVEPLTVRIERVKGNAKHSMPIPIREGFPAPGQGWTQEEILSLEQWCVGSWGGGTWQFTVTDSNQPPELMTWIQVYPTSQYPEKSPAPADVMAASMPPMPFSTLLGGPPQTSPWPQTMPWGTGPSTMIPHQPQNQFGVPMPNPWMQNHWNQGPWNQGPQRSGEDYRAEAEKARLQMLQADGKAQIDRLLDENRRMAEAIQKAHDHPREDPALKAQLEREREERHKAERAAEHAAFEARLALMTASAKPTGPSEEALRLTRLEEDRKRDEERRRYEDQLKEMRDESRRREDALALEMRALRDRPTGPDPMIQFLMQQQETARETARIQADGAKEAARLQSEAMRERGREQSELINGLKAYMMSPMETARLVNDASQGQHQFVKSMASTFNDVAGVMSGYMRNMMENMAGPAESPVTRVVEGTIATAKEMFDRWNTSKTQADVARTNAQRDVMRAQAEASRPWMPGEGQPVAQPVTPSPAANGNGQAQTWVTPPPVAQAGLSGATVPSPLREGGKTDEQWFGPALPDMLQLREGILHFIESISMQPMRMMADGSAPEGISPDKAAQYILMAANLIAKENVQGVVAFDRLFGQQMYSDLMKVLLPDGMAPASMTTGFRDDTLKYLYRLVEGKSLHEVEDRDDDGEDHDADADDDSDDENDHDDNPDQDGIVVVVPAKAKAKAKAKTQSQQR